MRVILVPPPEITYHKNRENTVCEPPLGLFCVSAVAREHGHQVVICDLNVAYRKGILPHSSRLHECAADYIMSFSPDVVGFGTICSSFAASLLICKHLKRKAPGLPVVFGGPQATAVSVDLLNEFKEIDFVLTGEADFSFSSFLTKLDVSDPLAVPGLVLRQNGEAISAVSAVVDVNLLPFPAYDLWPFKEALRERWFHGPVRLELGRGCPFDCSFCSSKLFFKRNYRLKSPQRIVEEMERLNKDYGFNTFTFTHDSFIVDREKAIDICEAIRRSNIDSPKWTCSARIDTVDEKLLEVMAASGCKRIFFGVESGSQRLQEAIGKNLELRRVSRVIQTVRDLELTCDISFIVGFPEEDWNDIEQTIDLFARYAGAKHVLPQIHVLAPHPGTAVTEMHRDVLQYDGYFADSSYFQRASPEQERDLIEQHPRLFQALCFVPNPRVPREILIHTVEFAILLAGSLPGVIPFIRATHGSVFDIIQRWRLAVQSRGFPMPSYNNFFAEKENDSLSYLSILLDVLSADSAIGERGLSFVRFWRACLGVLADGPLAQRAMLSSQGMLGKNGDDGATSKAGLATSEGWSILILQYDVFRSIMYWREKGKWFWPKKHRTIYLISRAKNVWPATVITDVTQTVRQWLDDGVAVPGILESWNPVEQQRRESHG